MRRSALLLVVFLVGFASLADFSSRGLLDTGSSTPLRIGDMAPRFVLPDANGSQVDFAVVLQESAAVVVKFWATWCPVCWIDLLELDENYARFRSRGVEVLTIAVGNPEDVDFYLENQPAPYPVLVDEEGSVAKRFGVRALPTTVLVNGGGTVVHTRRGLSLDLESQLALLPALQAVPVEPDP